MVRYPHILKYSFDGSESEPTQDENGNWINAEPVLVVHELACRAEPNGSGSVISSNDGKELVYSWLIYFNDKSKFIKYGQEIEVFVNGILLVTGTCKRFSKGQITCRLWV